MRRRYQPEWDRLTWWEVVLYVLCGILIGVALWAIFVISSGLPDAAWQTIWQIRER